MIKKINVAKIADLIHAAVITIPGIAWFAKVDDTENNEDNVTMLLKNYSQSIKLRQDGLNLYIYIYISLLFF